MITTLARTRGARLDPSDAPDDAAEGPVVLARIGRRGEKDAARRVDLDGADRTGVGTGRVGSGKGGLLEGAECERLLGQRRPTESG